MNPEMERMLEKVQKLFALANNEGATDAEAFNAAQRAREIMQKYNITMSDVEGFKGFEQSDVNVEKVKVLKKKPPNYASLLASAVAKLYDCKLVTNFVVQDEHDPTGYDRNACTFDWIGVNADPIVAKWAYKFLGSHGKRKCREAMYGVRDTAEYMFWYADSIYRRVEELKFTPQENALVPVKDVAIKDKISELYPRLSKGRPMKGEKFGRAGQAGAEEGKRVSLDRPLDEEQRGALSA